MCVYMYVCICERPGCWWIIQETFTVMLIEGYYARLSACVYVCVCMYVCMYVCVCMCVCMYVYVCVYV